MFSGPLRFCGTRVSHNNISSLHPTGGGRRTCVALGSRHSVLQRGLPRRPIHVPTRSGWLPCCCMLLRVLNFPTSLPTRFPYQPPLTHLHVTPSVRIFYTNIIKNYSMGSCSLSTHSLCVQVMAYCIRDTGTAQAAPSWSSVWFVGGNDCATNVDVALDERLPTGQL